MDGMSGAIEAVDLCFSWNEKAVVKAWSFKLYQGECAALVGPNGAGKTTLLRLLSGTLRQQRGEVFYDGVPARSLSPRSIARRVAVVPQDFHLPFSFTAAQVVEQGRTPFQRPFLFSGSALNRNDREIVESAMESTGSLELRDRVFNELSGGERQRVRIAMALAQTPEFMLLDEPLQNLDLGWQGEILSLIRDLSRKGVTVMAAIHDLNLVQSSCFSSALLVDPGEGLLHGSLKEVLEKTKLEKAFGTGLECIQHGSDVRLVLPASLASAKKKTEAMA